MILEVTINGESVFTKDIQPYEEFGFRFSVEAHDEETVRNGYTNEQYRDFSIFHETYPGKKRGIETEFTNFRKKHKKDWRIELSKLTDAIKSQAKYNLTAKFRGGFVPEWPMMSVWINQRRWEIIPPVIDAPVELNKNINFKSI